MRVLPFVCKRSLIVISKEGTNIKGAEIYILNIIITLTIIFLVLISFKIGERYGRDKEASDCIKLISDTIKDDNKFHEEVIRSMRK